MTYCIRTFARILVCNLAMGVLYGQSPSPTPATAPSTAPTITPGRDSYVIHVASDGFPHAGSSPEGAACDLARAFINSDYSLFQKTCLPAQPGSDYQKFLDGLKTQMEGQTKKPEASRTGPAALGICFLARHLSKSGPDSAAYAIYDFQDVMFVDVGVLLHGGHRSMCRTLVVQTSSGQWLVIPRPDLFQLLAGGLNDESSSSKIFTDIPDAATRLIKD